MPVSGQVEVKYHRLEQAPSRGHEASPQSGLDVGYKLRSSRKELCGLSVRAQAPLQGAFVEAGSVSLPRVVRMALNIDELKEITTLWGP